MALSKKNNTDKEKNVLAAYNMAVNLGWSALHLTPVAVYCFNFTDQRLCYIFLTISLIPVFFKNIFLDRIRAGRTTKFYKRIGVHLINKVTQNGTLINSLIKRRFPAHKIITPQKKSIHKLIHQTYLFEKFHLMLLLFFCMTAAHAFIKEQVAWGIIILLTNITYNIYPCLLQQYIRLKLSLAQNMRGAKI